MSHAKETTKPIYYALAANFGISLAKIIGALLTGSGSMLAEAIHSFSDTGNQILLLWGLKRSAKPVTEDHPLGYGKAIYFWSFIVAIMLFSMGGLFSIYEGLHKFNNPARLENPLIAIIILFVSLVLEGLSLLGALSQVKKIKGPQTYAKWFHESRDSELIVVVGEDTAAVLGLSCALLAVTISALTGNTSYDALGSIAIGIILIAVAISIAVQIKGLLIGKSASPELKREIRQLLENESQVEKIYNLITLQLGKEVMVSVKAGMGPVKSGQALIKNINDIEKKIRNKFPQVRWIFFEPDIQD